ncbi:aminoacyl-tRNA hydrolase [soil metagenome]
MIVGLGNPGPQYQETRHNAGFLVLDELARRSNLSFRKARNADEAKGDLLLVKPTTFMNLSGQAVQAYMAKSGFKPEHILVVHDDLDLPLGRLRLKQGGGAGGQRGVKDIVSRIGPDFARLKVGIGRPPERWTVENWVLSKFRPEETTLLEAVIAAAADAVEQVVAEGLTLAMNRVNGLELGDNQSGE